MNRDKISAFTLKIASSNGCGLISILYDIYEEYDDVSTLKINYHDFIDKYNFDYMIVKNKSGLGYLMKNDSYKYTNIMNLENHTLYKLNGE